jgi:hypothetical protein
MRAIQDAPEDNHWVNSKIHYEAAIQRVQRFTCTPCPMVFGNALGAHNAVNLKIHSEAVIEHVRRFTCRLWSSEIGVVRWSGCSKGDWWEARCVPVHHSSVGSLKTVAKWQVDFFIDALMENRPVAANQCREPHPQSDLHSAVNL